MIQTNWCVITGAPSSGKTTLINQLAQQGFLIAPEIARDYIEKFLANNHSLEDIQQNTRNLQGGILDIALEREKHLKADQLMFFDRGTADSIGYFNYYHLEVSNAIQTCNRNRYKKIFYCHQLPVVHDQIRIEDNFAAQEIGRLIYQAYKELGYQLIELPAISVEQRLKILLTHIELANDL